jgi:hypothetical protein
VNYVSSIENVRENKERERERERERFVKEKEEVGLF